MLRFKRWGDGKRAQLERKAEIGWPLGSVDSGTRPGGPSVFLELVSKLGAQAEPRTAKRQKDLHVPASQPGQIVFRTGCHASQGGIIITLGIQARDVELYCTE